MCRFYSSGFFSYYNQKSGFNSSNKSFQLYGFEVDIINSVHFSNHTSLYYVFLNQIISTQYIGYNTVKGSRLTADELRDIFQGLLANELLEYDYILTGL